MTGLLDRKRDPERCFNFVESGGRDSEGQLAKVTAKGAATYESS
jgi:hypothetical protein